VGDLVCGHGAVKAVGAERQHVAGINWCSLESTLTNRSFPSERLSKCRVDARRSFEDRIPSRTCSALRCDRGSEPWHGRAE